MKFKVKTKEHLTHHFKTAIKAFDPNAKIYASTTEAAVFLVDETKLTADEVRGFTSVEKVYEDKPLYKTMQDIVFAMKDFYKTEARKEGHHFHFFKKEERCSLHQGDPSLYVYCRVGRGGTYDIRSIESWITRNTNVPIYLQDPESDGHKYPVTNIVVKYDPDSGEDQIILS